MEPIQEVEEKVMPDKVIFSKGVQIIPVRRGVYKDIMMEDVMNDLDKYLFSHMKVCILLTLNA